MTRMRDDIELDLPFLVNGTLAGADLAEMDAWLADDAQLAAECDALAGIREAMQAEDIRSPGEFGLARLMRDVMRDVTRDVTREGAGPVVPSQPVQGRPWLWQAAAAVAVVGLLAQAFFLRDTNPPHAGYTLASAAAPGALVVGFAPDATEERIRSLLVGQDLEIVAGPSALGLYRLDVRDGGDLTAVTAALRAATAIVESVENAAN